MPWFVLWSPGVNQAKADSTLDRSLAQLLPALSPSPHSCSSWHPLTKHLNPCQRLIPGDPTRDTVQFRSHILFARSISWSGSLILF